MKKGEWKREIPDVPLGTEIPRILHQIHLGTSAIGELPESIRLNVQGMAAANPGWEHRLYDSARAERFIADHYGAGTLAAYLRIRPEYGAARADLLRYLVIYKHGGVYLDLKSRFRRPLDEVINGNEQYILSRWRNGKGEKFENFGLHPDLAHVKGGEFQQFHVIAAPGHPFLRAVIERVLSNIDNYSPWRFGVGRIGVLRVTGPVAYTLAIAPLQNLHPCKTVASEEALDIEYVTEGSRHQNTFKTHYSLLDTPITELPLTARCLGMVYTQLKRLKNRMQGGDP